MVGTRGDTQLEAIRSAWLRYVVLIAGVGLVLMMSVWIVWPWPYYFAVERFVLPQYEDRLGYRGGLIPVTSGRHTFTVYGFSSVQPGGVMSRAGVRTGDIPVDRHNPVGAFYYALQQFDSGHRGEFYVLAPSDWQDWSKRRRISLVPETEQRAPQEP